LRGAALVAFSAKAVVPVGYMPAPLAEGGIRLCDSAAFARAAVPAAHDANAAHDHDPGHDRGDDHGHGHDHGPGDDHDHGNGSAGHHEWERCSLGGLAMLAAVPSEWGFAVTAKAPARVAPPDVTVPVRRIVTGFRSRAPPAAHSFT
jgi:hypothetical protein